MMLVSVATRASATLHASRKSSAPVAAVTTSDMMTGDPNMEPMLRSSACPGGNFDATAGRTRTCDCSNASGTGGVGADQCPPAKIFDCSRYDCSSETTATGFIAPHTHHVTSADTSPTRTEA